MCVLRRKLLLFDYLIGKLVEWQARNDFSKLSMDDIDKILKTMSGTRLMKLLYIISIVNINDSINSLDETLFGVFDDYVAMKNGPVEDFLYHNRSILLRFSFYSGELKTSNSYHEHFKFNYPEVDRDIYESDTYHHERILADQLNSPRNNHEGIETPLNYYKDIIDNNIQYLKDLGDAFPFEDVEKLIEITHRLPLWNQYINKEDKHYKLNIDDLQSESIVFKEANFSVCSVNL